MISNTGAIKLTTTGAVLALASKNVSQLTCVEACRSFHLHDYLAVLECLRRTNRLGRVAVFPALMSLWFSVAMMTKAAYANWEVKLETNPFDKTSSSEMSTRFNQGLPVIVSLGCTLHGYTALTVVTEQPYKAQNRDEIFRPIFQVKVDGGEVIGLSMQAYETKHHLLAYRSSKGTTDAVMQLIEQVKTTKDLVALRPQMPYAADNPGSKAIFMVLPVTGIEKAATQVHSICKS